MPSICTKPLTAGDVIFEYKPLIHVLESEFKGKFCDNCVERSDQLKRCSKCLQMYYCGKSCQTMDWKYHKNECKVFRNQLFNPNLYSSEERMILRLWLCVKFDETFATKRHQLFDGSDVSLNDIKIHNKKLTRKVFGNCFRSVSQYLKYIGIEFNRKELLNWFQIFATNCPIMTKISICGKTSPNVCIGWGFCLQLSHISHSCIPNTAIVSTEGLSLQLRAMKSIGFGEELTISYIDLEQNKTQRQTELKTDFMIDCKCDKCVKNLDSKVDYKLFNRIEEQLILYCITGTNVEELFESMSKLIPFLNTIYGEYHPQKTLDLYWFSSLFLYNKYPNQEFIKQLTDSIKHSIRVTYGESHEFNHFFQRFQNFYEFQRLFTLFSI